MLLLNSMKMVFMIILNSKREHGAKRSAAEQVDYLEELIGKYPIITIEDGMDENDWEALETIN